MADRWLKTSCLLASASAFWLAALSPIPNIARAATYGLAITASVQLVQESRRLMVQDARRAALLIMNRELEHIEIALHTQQQEQALYEVYGAYPPEVKDELTKSLEHLYQEPSANHDHESSGSTSTSTSDKSLYRVVKALLEAGKSETFVIEEVLKLRGRRFAEGQARLRQLLEEGQRNEWD
ncbi:hypothetical protein [Nostoc sp. CCY0012]|uniref:hypothetical protein n=1 Tax=Nostoc sp. CCY0012 TaxID=1056123 RepID=UPI0039C61575